MKKLYFIIALFAIGLMVFTINAQKIQSSKNIFKPGWFIGANAGPTWFLAEGNNVLHDNNKVTFSKNVGAQGGLLVGYDFNPIYSLKGTAGYRNYRYFPGANARSIPNEYLNIDMLYNLSNKISGYNAERKINLSAFAGIGLANMNNNTASSKFGGALRGGLQGDYNLSNKLSLNIILAGNILSDNINDGVVGTPFDLGAALTAGFTYRLREKAKTKMIAPGLSDLPKEKNLPDEKIVEPTAVVPQTPVETPKPEIAKVDTPVKVVVPETKPIAKQEPIAANAPATKENVQFKFNSRVVENENQEQTIARIVDYLNKYPQAKVVVSGYADNASGTKAINNEISKQRALNVANTLISKHGIDSKRLMVKWYGSSVQPYSEVYKNRVVIINSANDDEVKNFKGYDDGISSIIKDAATKVDINFATANANIVNDKQREALLRISNYLKENPTSLVLVKGYASKTSGTDAYNDMISKKRAVSVANLLIQEYDIDSKKIKVSWYGGRVQPYTTPAMNQLVTVSAQ